MADKNQKEPQLTARLEVIEDEATKLSEISKEPVMGVSDDNPNRPKLNLTPEQIAVLEAEKAQLLGELRGRVAQQPRIQQPVAVEPLPMIEIPPSPELEAATAAVADIDEEIDALVRQEEDTKRKRREALEADDRLHQSRMTELRSKRIESEARQRELRTVQANAEVALRMEQNEANAARARDLAQATEDQKTAEVTARITPLLAVAKRAHAELVAIQREHGPHLAKFTRMEWRDVPVDWPRKLQEDYWQLGVVAGVKLEDELRHLIAGCVGPNGCIPRAEKILRVGWSDSHEFTIEVNTIVRDLGYTAEYVRPIRESLMVLNDNLKSIFERADHAVTERIARGEPAPETRVVVTAEERGRMMMAAREAQDVSAQERAL